MGIPIPIRPPPLPTGSLKVTIEPTGAIDDGALWRIDEGDWHDSEDVVGDIEIGYHVVNYKEIPDWYTPEDEEIEILEDETVETVGTYISKLVAEDCQYCDVGETPLEIDVAFGNPPYPPFGGVFRLHQNPNPCIWYGPGPDYGITPTTVFVYRTPIAVALEVYTDELILYCLFTTFNHCVTVPETMCNWILVAISEVWL